MRAKEDSETILSTLKNIQLGLYQKFESYPSLVDLFKNEFCDFKLFISFENVMDLILREEFLIPEQETYPFYEEGKLRIDYLKSYEDYFKSWSDETVEKHHQTMEYLKSSITLEDNSQKLECRCKNCVADFRTKIWELIIKSSFEIMDEAKEEILDCLEDGDDPRDTYFLLQKDLDKLINRNRTKLRKSSINKLDSQIKKRLKEEFNYPSEVTIKYSETLRPFFEQVLKRDGLRKDLVGEYEYERFFTQLSLNIWKKERYLEREFKKLVKSVLLLKRKDISGKILKDYLGEFWVHSRARDIKRKIIYHAGPTNSGKTYSAIESLAKADKGCYLAPLRLLAAELYDTLNNKEVTTTLLTGEEVIEKEGATHYSSTIEMARFQEVFDCCVIDEIQMITDPQRGWAWTRALVNIFASEIHICGDDSVIELIREIVNLCGDELEVRYYERMTKLVVDQKTVRVGDLKKGDALIVFSRKNALRYKMDLEQLGFRVSIIYGRLSPEVRREQARKFDSEETDIIVSTDAIAMGMNLPIKRIVFSTLSKYINSVEHPITQSEIKQIAGRAGRYKRHPIGHVTCLTKVEDGIYRISDSLSNVLDQKKQCMVGPDLDIFSQVNTALQKNALPELKLSEFLRLFNTMSFKIPFYCVDLKEMIEVSEMVENVDHEETLVSTEVFGFSCAPVNLGLVEHVEFFIWILNKFVRSAPIKNQPIDSSRGDIDYLETSIKCVELYQWLSRHFNNKNFHYDEEDLLTNKSEAIEKLNDLLSKKIVPSCTSCGAKLSDDHKFRICDLCFRERRFTKKRNYGSSYSSNKKSSSFKSNKSRPYKKKKHKVKRRK
ncbi:MAG: helicase-related protein [Bacteriovoracaceae bacterium]